MRRGPQRSRGALRPSCASRRAQLLQERQRRQLRQQRRDRVDEVRLLDRAHGLGTIQRGAQRSGACRAMPAKRGERAAHLLLRADPDCCRSRRRRAARAFKPGPETRRRRRRRAGARRRRARLALSVGAGAARARCRRCRARAAHRMRSRRCSGPSSCSCVHHAAISRGGQAAAARAAPADRTRRESAAARAAAARACRAAAPGAAAAHTSRARPRATRRGMVTRVAASRSARSQASTMAPTSCQRCGGSDSISAAIGPYSSNANRKVGVTGLSAATRASVLRNPCSSSCSTRLPGCSAR